MYGRFTFHILCAANYMIRMYFVVKDMDNHEDMV